MLFRTQIKIICKNSSLLDNICANDNILNRSLTSDILVLQRIGLTYINDTSNFEFELKSSYRKHILIMHIKVHEEFSNIFQYVLLIQLIL